MTLAEIAAAKVNLTLHVLGRRPDGYHELESLVAFAGIGDEVTLDTSGPPSLEVAGPFAAAIEGENLITRALAMLAGPDQNLVLGSVRLIKQLPVAAGLGGGSADAAALLRSVRRANPGSASRVDWSAIAARLGADVSVCLESRAALMTGIGECVALVTDFEPLPALLVNPGVQLPTRAVFEALAAPSVSPRTSVAESVDARNPVNWIGQRRNDLERPASRLAPAVLDVLGAIRRTPGCRLARMSGSGPTCFGIYRTVEETEQAAHFIRTTSPAWWVAATALR
jgi:4-diphosphocytidyl-2-C-methyl-D-erythritol kinase